MPEPPDFDAIALRMIHPPTLLPDYCVADVAAKLRQVWNARGAADCDAIDTPFMGLGPFREKVHDAIRKLDR